MGENVVYIVFFIIYLWLLYLTTNLMELYNKFEEVKNNQRK